ncbi:MAG: alpha/beta hydrolase, partial [Betaproteobacteria bacterium]
MMIGTALIAAACTANHNVADGGNGTSANFAGIVAIGHGRSMFVECTGSGSPTVVLVAGQRGSAADWHITESKTSPVEPAVYGEVARFTRVCAYDRPGTPVGNQFSRSDPAPQPADAATSTADLHALLHAAGQSVPFVLVGHSAGGMIVRLYASTYPREVTGMVLVDALGEGLQDAQTSAQWATQRILLRGDIDASLIEYPDLEYFDADRSFEQIRAAPAMRPMPLVVLSADAPIGPMVAGMIPGSAWLSGVPTDFGFVIDAAQKSSQAQLARLVPHAKHVTDTHSGHNIHHEQPQLVV